MPLDELHEYLHERAGDALRVLSWYSPDRSGTLYVRDDLDREQVEKRVEFVSNRSLAPNRPRSKNPLDGLGDEEAMVQVRAEAVIIRFPMEGTGGIVVSLDSEVARDLHGFIVECAERLGGSEPAAASGASG